MKIECPKCGSNKILKRKAVSRIETHGTRVIDGKIVEVPLYEPLFYVCYSCWHQFNIK